MDSFRISFCVRFVLSFLVIGWGKAGFSQENVRTNLIREIDRLIVNEQPVDFSLVPGVLIGVMIRDSQYVVSLGETPHKSTVFELGSVTKPVVDFMVRAMLQDQHIDATSSICTYLPDSLCSAAWQEVTIDELLMHRSGLPKITPGMADAEDDVNDPYARYDMEALAKDMKLMSPQPEKYSYSHLNYAVLHWLIEDNGGRDELLENYLVTNLHLTSPQFDIPDSLVAPGYGKHGASRPPWHPDLLSIALGLKMSITDMLQFMDTISHVYDNVDLSSPGFDKKVLNRLANDEIYKVVGGWFMVPSGQDLIFFHTGHTGGHHVSIAFIPAKHVGVAVFANSSAGTSDLSIRLLDMLARGK